MGLAADRLLQLSGSVHGSVSDHATALLVTAACQFAQLCALVCGRTGVPQPLPRFLSCAQLLLRSGAAAQQFIAQGVQRGTLPSGVLYNALSAQVWALEAWQLLICGLPDGADMAAAAEACAPPALLRQWVQQCIASLRLLEPSWKPGAWV